MGALDIIVATLGFGSACMVIGLVVSPVIPSYVPPLHPIFMSIGTCIFLTLGVTSYTANFGKNFQRRAARRSLHGTLMLFGVLCIVVAFINVVSIKGNDVHPSFTGHAILGYTTMFLIFLQFVIGMLKYRVKERDGKVAFKWHTKLGPLVYVMLLLNMILGITSAIWSTNVPVSIVVIIVFASLGITALLSICFGPRKVGRRSGGGSLSRGSLGVPLHTDDAAGL